MKAVFKNFKVMIAFRPILELVIFIRLDSLDS